jgi:transposase-like protein
MSKRRTHGCEFKTMVAIEAINGRKTLQEIAADYAVHPIQVSQWKKQLLECASGSSEVIQTSGSRIRPCPRHSKARVEKSLTLEGVPGHDLGLTGDLSSQRAPRWMDAGPA